MPPMPSGPAGRRWLAAAALCASYLKARSVVLQKAEQAGNRVGPRWLGLLAWQFLNKFSELMGVRLASEGGEGLQLLDKSRRYMIVWHPHGFLAWSAMFIVSRMAVMGHPHGQEWFAMVAPALFRIPIISEALMLVNGRRVDKKVVENYAKRGKSIALQPGGVKEQMVSRHDQEQAIFPANLGFVRMALKYGLDLLPVYIFNENQMFKRVDGFEKGIEWAYKRTGFGLPMVTARFGLPMCFLLPLSTEIHVRWGAPVEVAEAVEDPSEDQVEELFCRYLAAVRRVFDQHAHECLPPEVAARGLKVTRLDGKPIPPHKSETTGAGAAAATIANDITTKATGPSRGTLAEARAEMIKALAEEQPAVLGVAAASARQGTAGGAAGAAGGAHGAAAPGPRARL